MLVYAEFGDNWAEVYEFPRDAFRAICAGNMDPLYNAGIEGFYRVSVEDASGIQHEVYRFDNRRRNY